MKKYLSKWKAIIALHERGFTEDFELVGNNMFWIEQKVWLQPEEFEVVEQYNVDDDTGNQLVILGVISNYYWAKGILISHDDRKDVIEAPGNNYDKFIKTTSSQIRGNFHYAVSDEEVCSLK